MPFETIYLRQIGMHSRKCREQRVNALDLESHTIGQQTSMSIECVFTF